MTVPLSTKKNLSTDNSHDSSETLKLYFQENLLKSAFGKEKVPRKQWETWKTGIYLDGWNMILIR